MDETENETIERRLDRIEREIDELERAVERPRGDPTVESADESGPRDAADQHRRGDATETDPNARRRFLNLLGGVASLGAVGAVGRAAGSPSERAAPPESTNDARLPGDESGVLTPTQVGTASEKPTHVYSEAIRAEQVATVRFADQYDGPTDGILAAMNDAPREGSVMVAVPRGGGSGPNGEYVVAPTEDLSASYDGGYGTSSVGVKVDRSDVFFVSDGAVVTVAPDQPCHTFLPSSYANDHDGRVAGTRIQNVHFRGLDFDGKGRDGIAVSWYEAIHGSMSQCRFRNWAPRSDSFFDDIPVRVQHHADAITFRNNVFRCDTNVNAHCKFDGSYHSQLLDNWFYVPAGVQNAGRMFRQNINGDFDRPSVSTDIRGNVFDVRAVGTAATTNLSVNVGMGTTLTQNAFLGPFGARGEEIRVGTRGGDAAYLSGKGLTLSDNTFLQWQVIVDNIDPPLHGLRISENTFLKTADNDYITGISISDGPVEGLVVKDNVMHNEAAEFPAPSNQGTFLGITADVSVSGVVADNTTVGVAEFAAFPSSATTFDPRAIRWENANTVDPSAEYAVPASENHGRATFSGDGSTDTVTVPHELVGVPSSWRVDAASAAAGQAGIDYVTANETELTVHFESVPEVGTDNVELTWEAAV